VRHARGHSGIYDVIILRGIDIDPSVPDVLFLFLLHLLLRVPGLHRLARCGFTAPAQASPGVGSIRRGAPCLPRGGHMTTLGGRDAAAAGGARDGGGARVLLLLPLLLPPWAIRLMGWAGGLPPLPWALLPRRSLGASANLGGRRNPSRGSTTGQAIHPHRAPSATPRPRTAITTSLTRVLKYHGRTTMPTGPGWRAAQKEGPAACRPVSCTSFIHNFAFNLN